jgi:hypothetical protein
MAAHYQGMTASGLIAVRTTPDWIRVAHGVTRLSLGSGFVVFGDDSVNHCWQKVSAPHPLFRIVPGRVPDWEKGR